VSVRRVSASGPDALALATTLIQRLRLADPVAGPWDAADVQWWSRKARPSDDIEQVFWSDGHGPVAGVLLTSWGEDLWQCDPISVPGVVAPELETLWTAASEQISAHAAGRVQVPVAGGDAALRVLVEAHGLVANEESSTAWMDAAARHPVLAPTAGYVLTDRTRRRGTSHPMRHRNGDAVQERLGRCSLYDPELDLAVETVDGQVAGYSLFWFDPVTKVGLVEPVRVEDAHARRGLARAMLTAGIDRLAHRGAERIKIGFESEAAAALYRAVGFRPTSRDTWYEARPCDGRVEFTCFRPGSPEGTRA